MKTKIERSELERMGATDRQIEAYSETDPLNIYIDGTGKYSMDGVIEGSGMTAQEVLEALDGLRDSWDE